MYETELRVVLNQCGAAMELHRTGKEPVMLHLFRPAEIQAYGNRLAATNPDMRYTSIGQVALRMAKDIARHGCPVSPYIWEYNANVKEYNRAY